VNNTQRIRALNDELRQHLLGSFAVMTPGVAALGQQAVQRITNCCLRMNGRFAPEAAIHRKWLDDLGQPTGHARGFPFAAIAAVRLLTAPVSHAHFESSCPPARASLAAVSFVRETRITRPPATFCRCCADSSSPRPRPLPSSPWSPAETERSNRHARSPRPRATSHRPRPSLRARQGAWCR